MCVVLELATAWAYEWPVVCIIVVDVAVAVVVVVVFECVVSLRVSDESNVVKVLSPLLSVSFYLRLCEGLITVFK